MKRRLILTTLGLKTDFSVSFFFKVAPSGIRIGDDAGIERSGDDEAVLVLSGENLAKAGRQAGSPLVVHCGFISSSEHLPDLYTAFPLFPTIIVFNYAKTSPVVNF
jgi:hypothetical protein